MERTLRRQEEAKAEEEALRGRRAGGDEEEWRLEYLKALNAGLDNQEVGGYFATDKIRIVSLFFLSNVKRSDGIQR